MEASIFQRRIKRSKQMYREESSAWMEMGMDNIARVDVLRLLGISDHAEGLELAGSMRAQFDSVLQHYQRHGRYYLPWTKPQLNPYYGWLLTLCYIAMTRARLHPRALPPFMVKVTRDPHLIMRVSYKILTFIHDHRTWDKGEEWVRSLLNDMNMPYNPVGTWRESDDILAVANLVGCRKWEKLGQGSLRSLKDYYKKNPDPQISEFSLDPDIAGVLPEEKRDEFLMAYAFNAVSIETQRPLYLTMPFPEDTQIDIMRMVLITNKCITMEGLILPDTDELIHELIRYMQVMRTEPIPQPRATELSKRMHERFGFNLLTDKNDIDQMRVFQVCSVFALCLSPEGGSNLLN